MSHPEESSVNDAIDLNLCSLSYITIEEVARLAILLGRGWLGMTWKGMMYVDGMLPFGLQSDPKIFNAITDALEWCARKEGVRYVHIPLSR